MRAALGPALALCAAGAAWAPQATPPGPAPAKQEAVVRQACATCHEVPPADILPRKAWKAVVLDMTALVVEGVGVPRGQPRPTADFDVDQVAYYFESRAPLALPSPEPWPAPGNDPDRFVRRPLTLAGPHPPPSVANVRFLPLGPKGEVVVVAADMLSGQILASGPRAASPALTLLGRVPVPCHVEAVDLDRDGLMDLLVSDLGQARPGDQTHGSVVWLRARAAGAGTVRYEALPLATGLPRVADAQAADFDGDGDLDLVVAAFGWRRVGGILLLENRTRDWTKPAFVPRTLDERSGAIHVPVADLDRDGHPDFVALLSQQHEVVEAFLGDGKGGFRKETIDRAPHPAWGSSGLQLVDLDGDGDLDVLVSNGDMLDDYQLKPYHGLRWLENRGRFPFVPHDLAPMFCVMRAQAGDVDGDGDLDVVAAALVQFKTDAGPPRSSPDIPSLVWLEQTAPGRFARHTLETGSQHLGLDLADVDGDGDLDIAAASSLSGDPAHVVLWENRGRRPNVPR
jgi:hypothetical protein